MFSAAFGAVTGVLGFGRCSCSGPAQHARGDRVRVEPDQFLVAAPGHVPAHRAHPRGHRAIAGLVFMVVVLGTQVVPMTRILDG